MKMSFDLPVVKSEAMADAIKAKATEDGIFAVAYSILVLAESTDKISAAVNKLGISDSNQEVGAFEAIAVALHRIADSFEEPEDCICDECRAALEEGYDKDSDDEEDEVQEQINIDIIYQDPKKKKE